MFSPLKDGRQATRNDVEVVGEYAAVFLGDSEFGNAIARACEAYFRNKRVKEKNPSRAKEDQADANAIDRAQALVRQDIEALTSDNYVIDQWDLSWRHGGRPKDEWLAQLRQAEKVLSWIGLRYFVDYQPGELSGLVNRPRTSEVAAEVNLTAEILKAYSQACGVPIQHIGLSEAPLVTNPKRRSPNRQPTAVQTVVWIFALLGESVSEKKACRWAKRAKTLLLAK